MLKMETKMLVDTVSECCLGLKHTVCIFWIQNWKEFYKLLSLGWMDR